MGILPNFNDYVQSKMTYIYHEHSIVETDVITFVMLYTVLDISRAMIKEVRVQLPAGNVFGGIWRRVRDGHLCHLCRFTPVFILLGYTRSVPDKNLTCE